MRRGVMKEKPDFPYDEWVGKVGKKVENIGELCFYNRSRVPEAHGKELVNCEYV